ncbi:MAG: metallophosphoesterase [Planctomycetes bacterium]|nr:metallophosphoesterase [Planctomycetota bacterium]
MAGRDSALIRVVFALFAFAVTASGSFVDGETLVITKGPYLQNPKPDSMTIKWEYTPPEPPFWKGTPTKTPTPDRTPAPDTLPSFKETDRIQGTVRYGTDDSLKQYVTISKSIEARYLWRKGPVETAYLFTCTLKGLSPGTKYYYQVETSEGTSDLSHFKTPPNEGDRFTFVAYGNTKFGVPHAEIARVIEKENPDFIIHTGDMVTDGRNYWQWEETFFKPLANVIDHIPIWPVMGNSDRRGSKEAERIFQLLFSLPGDELRYSFDYGPAHFVCLDCYRMVRNPEDVEWCEKDLTGSKALWKIVFTHDPAFNSGGYEPKRGRKQYVPMFQNCGVNMHLSGRCRFYQRFHPLYLTGTDPRSSIVYVITGAATWGFDDPAANPTVAGAAKKRHYIFFSGEGTKLSARVMDLEGKTIDRFTIVKNKDGSYADSHLETAIEAPE